MKGCNKSGSDMPRSACPARCEQLRRLLDEVEDTVAALSAPLRPGGAPDEQRPLLAAYVATRLKNSAEGWQKEAVRAAGAADCSWDDIAQALRTSTAVCTREVPKVRA